MMRWLLQRNSSLRRNHQMLQVNQTKDHIQLVCSKKRIQSWMPCRWERLASRKTMTHPRQKWLSCSLNRTTLRKKRWRKTTNGPSCQPLKTWAWTSFLLLEMSLSIRDRVTNMPISRSHIARSTATKKSPLPATSARRCAARDVSRSTRAIPKHFSRISTFIQIMKTSSRCHNSSYRKLVQTQNLEEAYTQVPRYLRTTPLQMSIRSQKTNQNPNSSQITNSIAETQFYQKSASKLSFWKISKIKSSHFKKTWRDKSKIVWLPSTIAQDPQ